MEQGLPLVLSFVKNDVNALMILIVKNKLHIHVVHKIVFDFPNYYPLKTAYIVNSFAPGEPSLVDPIAIVAPPLPRPCSGVVT